MSDYGSSLFEEAFAVASGDIDEVFGEAWQYQPFAVANGDVNGRPSPDPERPEQAIVGVYQGSYARAFSGPVRHQGVTPGKPGHASDRPVCDLALCRLPYPPRNGDRVVRLKTGDIFKVAEVRPNGVGRAALDLNRLSTPEQTLQKREI